ncbi:hypothetical protein [Bacillus sp. SM2101]|uniref:hypothetical protein n=1 Tax=Bacillus sp. SM2101 TaxID=2805366 RepID=UPI001BDE0672|nr:hypothetical protein [Bacillus sp. SM2101]
MTERLEVFDNTIEGLIKERLHNDKLFEEAQKRPEIISNVLNEAFLDKLDEHHWYSTSDAGEILDCPDSTVRYYIKQLENYIIPENAPTVGKGIRIDYISLIKLKMALLLRDEFKVSGLKMLVGIDGAVVNTPTSTEIDVESSDRTEIERLEYIVKQMLSTGLFNISEEKNAEGYSLPKVTLNNDILQKIESANNLLEGQTKVEERLSLLEQDRTKLSNHIEDLEKERQKNMSWETRTRLRSKALKKWDEQSFLKRKFAKESEKEEFIQNVIDKLYDEEMKD